MKLLNPATDKFLIPALFLVLYLGPANTSYAKVLTANPNANPGAPDYYRNLVSQLQPGDTLQLPAGAYRERINLSNVQGKADRWITITGPESGAPAIITTSSDCCNNVRARQHVVRRHKEPDD